MLRFLYLFMILPILFCSQANLTVDLFNEVKDIEYYKDGQIIELSEEEQARFEELFCEALSDAQQAPAYGVSLHENVVEQMKEGIWIKFIFEETLVKSDMTFDELLINVQKDCYGINIIRGNNGKYEGRCYYLNLKNSLDNVYDFIDNVYCKNTMMEVELESQNIEKFKIVEEDTLDEDNENTNNSGRVINQNPIDEEDGEKNKASQELLKHLC